MLTFSIQSGSNGNCIYVEAGDTRLLFDAGVAARTARERMLRHGRDPADCDALIISHDHSDHSRSAGIFQRRFGLPVYMSRAVHRAIAPQLGRVSDIRHYAPGDRLEFGDVTVYTIPTPHDGIDTVCFLIRHEDRRLAILTDLGHPFAALPGVLQEAQAAYLESNYDPDLLESGPYPAYLKSRIAGRGGHLSNEESAAVALRGSCTRLKWLALAHLSEQNNRPELALEAHRRKIGATLPVVVASRYDVGALLEV